MSDQPRSRPRPATAPLSAVAIVLVLVLVGSGCGGDDDGSGVAGSTSAAPTIAVTSTSTTTTTRPSTTTTSAPATGGASTTTGAVDPTAPTTSGPLPGAITDPVPDGTNFGYVTAIDVGSRTISVDLAELLTGDAAVRAALEDGALEPGATSIDNDYYVRNRNPLVRTAPVADDALVQVLVSEGGVDLRPGGLRDLAAAVTRAATTGGTVPVQLVASGGRITRVEQVFFP